MSSNRMSYLRGKRGLTQGEASKILGLHRSTYSNYEAGNREPDNETLIKIAKFYDVSIDYLLGRETESKKGEMIFTHLDLSDEEIVEKLPIVYKGKQLTEAQKREYLAIIRNIHDLRQGQQGN